MKQAPDLLVTTLPGGVRCLGWHMPHLDSAAVGVFVRSGSQHETRASSGVGHFVEHMVFKGTRERDARRINRDAESLGAEVNAHTDKDHTAFHMRGLATDALQFVDMLGDLVQHPTFPPHEIEAERQVLLQELLEEEDDAMSTAFKLFDSACWGSHPAALPVIGSARQVQRLAREDLAAVVAQRYTGANIVVAGAGRIDLEALARRVERAFASVAAGTPNDVPPPQWHGGVKVRPLPGSNQAHVVLGLPIAGLCADDPVAALAAAVFGEGMSSPLMDELRERRGLVYYAACSADRFETIGQFVIEASTAPEHLLQAVRVVLELLQRHAASIDAAELERARKQVLVRRLRALERPGRRVEDSALELLALGRLTAAAETRERLLAVTAEQVRQAFADMLAHPLALAATGKVPRTSGQQLREGLDAAGGRLRSPPAVKVQHA